MPKFKNLKRCTNSKASAVSDTGQNSPENENNEPRVLNLLDTTSKALAVDPETVPTLANSQELELILKKDPEPYFKIQRIEYPITGNRIIYPESFFNSFINKIKARPIPGSKSGHSLFSSDRPDTDFYLIGGKIESNGDGTGAVYFKNYIPKSGATSSNDRFIEENKLNMVHYSLVTYPRINSEYDPVKDEFVRTAIETLRGERNDAVEYGMGAMQQQTNSDESGKNVKKNVKKKGEKHMNKDELLKALNNLMENGQLGLAELADSAKFADKLVNADHVAAVEIKKNLDAMEIADPVAEIEKLQKQVGADTDAVINAQLDVHFGASSKNAGGEETNLLREYAAQKLTGVERSKMGEAIANVKKDPIAKKLAGDAADPNAVVNVIESAAGATGAAEQGSKTKREEY